jgi:hypothetical protein
VTPAEYAGGIVNHGDGNYEASYVVTRAGEYQLVRMFSIGSHAERAVTRGCIGRSCTD